jgi:hypothetical protein
MTDSTNEIKPPRLPVSLSNEDAQVIMKLQAILQDETGRRWSLARIVREGLYTLAREKGVVC